MLQSITPYIIPFLSLIQLIPVSAASCSLCWDGSEIPTSFRGKPIGLLSPVPIPTCESLQGILSILPDNSPLCQSGLQLGPYCGCPVTDNACRICGSSEGNNNTLELAEPSFSLAGLVENLPDMFGLEPTCELFESGLNLLNNTDDQCGDLALQELRLHCKCEDPTIIEETADHCSFCVTGEDPPYMSTTGLIFFEDDTKLSSCQDLWDLSLETSPDSPTCTSIHEHTYSCNCVEVPNACRMCEREMLHREEFIIDTSGNQINCRNYEAKLRTIEQTDPLCHVTDDMVETCGCVDELPDNICTICPDGSKVPLPDKDLTDQLAFLGQYLDVHVLPNPLTCAFVEAAVGIDTLLGSPTCDAAQLLAKICGCSSAENACHLCGSKGHVMTKPLAQTVWIFGDANENVDLGLAFQGDDAWDVATKEKQITCELMDSGLANAVQEGSTHCFSNQINFSELCGCKPTNRRAEILVWCQRVMGTLSFLASLLIILYILRQPKKKRWTTYNQLLLGISLFDSVGSLSLALGPVMVPDTYGSYQSSGNHATCQLQGFMFQLGQTSMFYNVVLSAYFLLAVKYGWTERKCGNLIKWCHVGVLFVGFAMAGASIPFHHPQLRWCYVLRPPFTASYLPATIFLILPVSLAILVITGQTIAMVLFVWKKEQKTMKLSMTKNKADLTRKAFVQSLWYLLAFYLVWPILFGSYLMWISPSNFWFTVVASILGPSQGLFNAMIFFHKRRAALARTKLGVGLSSFFSSVKGSFHSSSQLFFNQSDETKHISSTLSTSSPRKKSLCAFLGRIVTGPRNSSSETSKRDYPSITVRRVDDGGEEEKESEHPDDNMSWTGMAGPNVPLPITSRQGNEHQFVQDTIADNNDAYMLSNVRTSRSPLEATESLQRHEDDAPIATSPTTIPNPSVRRQAEAMTRRVSVLLGIHELGLQLSDEDDDDNYPAKRGEGAFGETQFIDSEANANGSHSEAVNVPGQRRRRASLNIPLRRRSQMGSNVTRRLSTLISRVVQDFSVEDDSSVSQSNPSSVVRNDSIQTDNEDILGICVDEKQSLSFEHDDVEESGEPEKTNHDGCTFSGLERSDSALKSEVEWLSEKESVSEEARYPVEESAEICVDVKQSASFEHDDFEDAGNVEGGNHGN